MCTRYPAWKIALHVTIARRVGRITMSSIAAAVRMVVLRRMLFPMIGMLASFHQIVVTSRVDDSWRARHDPVIHRRHVTFWTRPAREMSNHRIHQLQPMTATVHKAVIAAYAAASLTSRARPKLERKSKRSNRPAAPPPKRPQS